MSVEARLAKYKGRRLVDPTRFADSYVVIEEHEFKAPHIVISTAVDNFNEIVKHEPKVTLQTFLQYSPLGGSLFAHYQYFRIRSLEITYTSSDVNVDFRRVQRGIYWIPNHERWDGGFEGFSNWIEFCDKTNTSLISERGKPGAVFKLNYVPQYISRAEVLDDEEDPAPPFVQPVFGNYQAGWMPTTPQFREMEARGPCVVFRRPYVPAGAISTPEVTYSVTFRAVIEFKKAKN